MRADKGADDGRATEKGRRSEKDKGLPGCCREIYVNVYVTRLLVLTILKWLSCDAFRGRGILPRGTRMGKTRLFVG